MKKGLVITICVLGLIALLFFTRNDTTDPTSKLPLITSFTNLSGEFLEGGSVCLEFTTVKPDKFTSKTSMDCKK